MDIVKQLRESCFCEGRGCELCRAADEIERLRAELSACQQDAERYRWLRDDCGGFEVTVREENEDGYESWVAGYPAEELDAAIDTARKGEGEE